MSIMPHKPFLLLLCIAPDILPFCVHAPSHLTNPASLSSLLYFYTLMSIMPHKPSLFLLSHPLKSPICPDIHALPFCVLRCPDQRVDSQGHDAHIHTPRHALPYRQCAPTHILMPCPALLFPASPNSPLPGSLTRPSTPFSCHVLPCLKCVPTQTPMTSSPLCCSALFCRILVHPQNASSRPGPFLPASVPSLLTIPSTFILLFKVPEALVRPSLRCLLAFLCHPFYLWLKG